MILLGAAVYFALAFLSLGIGPYEKTIELIDELKNAKLKGHLDAS